MQSRIDRYDCFSRRQVLGGLALGASALLAKRSLADPEATLSEGLPKTPDEALAQLYAGNQRFAQGKPLAPHRGLDRLKEVASKQSPFAAFLGCADSRVPIEVVFDQGFGDLFVTRVAGNVADPAIIGSLEFGTQVLGAKIVYVLGHTSCGAVSAAIKGGPVPGQISTLYQHLQPATKAAGGDLSRGVIANVRNQMEILSEASPVLVQLIKEGKLKVAGGVYDLASGRVSPVKVG